MTGAPAGTSANSNAVAVLSMTAALEYEPQQLPQVINKLDELIQQCIPKGNH